MKMKDSRPKTTTIPTFVAFELKGEKPARRKNDRRRSPRRRSSGLPVGTRKHDTTTAATPSDLSPKRRSTMPQVSREEKEALLPLSELALLFLKPLPTIPTTAPQSRLVDDNDEQEKMAPEEKERAANVTAELEGDVSQEEQPASVV
mmetsp:Transcript_22753/g.37679  ORF Transcript_22753/g.37679 Transcript_22753/m.37679 type:complete len:147 (-) Transcript_22753:225-665(-)|eukprot:CAMPEP_0119009674 /NCGR_PEP_ID=MMETSP1176-20130426/4524_1 /TAXON_ID=265551 /ORGANISM="Synedropsis recta cf, Strain CCMP1620" /LENGTH=146 /DNA_ID=CAMNT_0006962229 /DNA_START=1 /DNA_END=441 /DNA_ORIENTATION=-